jgi:hypothetical protein
MTLIILEGKREVKGVDSLSSIDTDIEVASSDSIDESFVFIFWIDDDDIMSEHETTKYLEFYSKRFTTS